MNSTAISLSWEPPALSQQNGVIDFYNISITDATTTTQTSLEVSSEHTQQVIASLHPYYLYEFKIAAGTISLGIYSSSLAIRTLQDGKKLLLQRCRKWGAGGGGGGGEEGLQPSNI